MKLPVTCLVACLTVPGCAASQKVCEAQGGVLDPLVSAFDRDPEVNGKLRAFFSAARGMRDAASQAEEITLSTCQTMGLDLGLGDAEVNPPNSAPGAAVVAVCGAVGRRIAEILQRTPMRVSYRPPVCQADSQRLGRCEALCASAAGLGIEHYCESTCRIEANIYGGCSASEVEMNTPAEPSPAADVVRLSLTLRRNLPWLLHAHTSLGGRLKDDVKTLATTGAELPRLLPRAGPGSLACLAGAVSLVTDAGREFDQTIGAGAVILNALQVTGASAIPAAREG
jgi:hypothetical protein